MAREGGYVMLFHPFFPEVSPGSFLCVLKQDYYDAFIHYRTFNDPICISHWLHPRQQRWPRFRRFGSKRVANWNCACNDGSGNGDRNSKTNISITVNRCPSRGSYCDSTHYVYGFFSEPSPQSITSGVYPMKSRR